MDTSKKTIVNNAVVDLSTGEITMDFSQSAFAAEHQNWDESIARIMGLLHAGEIAEARAKISAVYYRAKEALEAGDQTRGSILLLLGEEMNRLRELEVRGQQLINEMQRVVLAQQGLIYCYPANNRRGYKGCGGAGMVLEQVEGGFANRTCKICGGEGVIERTAEAKRVFEDMAKRHGSVAKGMAALIDEYNANPFTPEMVDDRRK